MKMFAMGEEKAINVRNGICLKVTVGYTIFCTDFVFLYYCSLAGIFNGL
jgi:hypothetical protein